MLKKHALKIVRVSATYDLVVTFAFALPVSELAEFVGYSVGARQSDVSRTALVEVAEAKLSDLNERIEDLKRTRTAIEMLLGLDCIDPASPCPIITALANSPSHESRMN